MLTPLRQEPVFFFANERHANLCVRDAVDTKNMHILWKEDTQETYNTILKADYNVTYLEKMVQESKESIKLQTEIVDRMPAYLDVFHFLQAKSKSYPYIDAPVIRKDMLDKFTWLSKDWHYR